MGLDARYHDGKVSKTRTVRSWLEDDAVVIAEPAGETEIDRWPADAIYELPGRGDELRLGANDRPPGARLVFTNAADAIGVRKMLPVLAKHQRREVGRQFRLLALGTAALGSVIAAWLIGVPLLADRIVTVVPPEWEASLGEVARQQIEGAMSEGFGLPLCDPNPQSVANRAIARFADATLEGSGSPFSARIDVVAHSMPNAFALPGGQAYFFSALLHETRSPDEFAGVMAHELGHVVYRHGMETLISTSATGLLIGFVLGDMTGLSVAGGLGAALIDTSFSRRAEREADRFAADAATRLGFDASALGELLERVAKDDASSVTFALLSSHPLTAERRETLAALAASQPPQDDAAPVFSDAEWTAIKSMCGLPPRDE
ncbi:M48 family metallopeptidase [Devosia sp.]|uniref:M48 family metallopeptidase n=1 Tax=Devosia sp. TaxID=1871048 RepID=UPI003A8CB7EF